MITSRSSSYSLKLNRFVMQGGNTFLELIPDRLKGRYCQLRHNLVEGKVLVEKGHRITARHIKHIEKAGAYSAGSSAGLPSSVRYWPRTLLPLDTGELIAKVNDEVTEDLIETA
jgi:DNA-directed RNA polymerase subunit beta